MKLVYPTNNHTITQATFMLLFDDYWILPYENGKKLLIALDFKDLCTLTEFLIVERIKVEIL